MPMQDLCLTNVGPFAAVTFEFDAHINVFVGPNSSGKSTTLMTLANIVTYPFVLPGRLRRKAPASFTVHFVGRYGQPQELTGSLPVDQDAPEQQARLANVLAALGYSAFVPALRQSTAFRTAGPVTRTTFTGPAQLPEELSRRRALLPTDATLMRDVAVLERMVEFADRAVRHNDPAMRRLLTQIASIASEILDGFPVEFWRIAEDRDGLFPQFRTLDGDLAFDVFSQGTQSILQWLAYVLIGYARYYGYPANLAEQPGIIIIDEIDAHLHPTAQQRILPVLRQHFPNLQIFCSTHSPLMLVGLEAGQVHLLQRNSQGAVSVSRNDTAIVEQSTDALLQQFFGLPAAVR
jgi:ABC-type cobalamin/Fe3+-siderophores transport system ATPase subunit